MSNNYHSQNSKGKLKYFPPSVKSKCPGCEELSKEFQLSKDAAEKRHNSLMNILAENKVLLDRIVKQNAVATNLMEFFPINTEKKLKEFDAILATYSDPYIRQMKSLLAGNAERNIHEVFGKGIIMSFNVDGSFDVISTFSESSDKTLRAAFQWQKKKYFKQVGPSDAKSKENQKIGDDYSNNED